MKRKRKGKPILQVLLIASLAINTTLSFVVLANRNRMVQATERRETVAAPAVITLEGATVESKVPTAANPVSQPMPWVAKKTVAPEATVRRIAPAKMEIASRERDEISFFPTPILYRLHAGYGSRHQKKWCENSYPARNPGPRGGHHPGR